MKTLIGSKNRSIIGIALLFAIFSMSNSCTKNSMSDMTGTGGDTGLFDSGTILTNGTYSYTFSTAGTYPYHCTSHSSMTATVKVS